MFDLRLAIHNAAVALRQSLFPDAVAQEAFIGDNAAVEAQLVAELGQLSWAIARERARVTCESPSATSAIGACERRAMAFAQIPVAADESDMIDARDALGADLDAALADLVTLSEEGTWQIDNERWPGWVQEYGGLIDTLMESAETEALGDRIFVVSYGRDGRPVASHMRSRPRTPGGSAGQSVSVNREMTFGEIPLSENGSNAMMTFGAHAESVPKGMLTGVKFDHLVLLNSRTNDGRMLHDAGFGARQLPLSFSAMFTTNHGPGQAVICGMLDQITVNEDQTVDGYGWLMDSAAGRTAGRLVQAKALRGNSVELSVKKSKMSWSEEDQRVVFDFLDYEVSATTLVANPAMSDCFTLLEDPEFDFGEDTVLDGETISLTEDAPREKILVGAGATVGDFSTFSATATDVEFEEVLTGDEPDRSLFDEPGQTAYPVRIDAPDKNGHRRVHGFVASFDHPHLAVGGMSIFAPRSQNGHAYFATGEVLCADGTRVSVGRLTHGGKHAGLEIDWIGATEHYDNTLDCWSHVAIGQNDAGIWVSGYVAPGTDDTTLAIARASALSGDWRRIGGRMELVGVLSVNAPAFPMPSAFSDAGLQTCLIGAGLIMPVWQEDHLAGNLLDNNTRADLKVLADDIRRREAAELEQALAEDLSDEGAALAAILEADELLEAL